MADRHIAEVERQLAATRSRVHALHVLVFVLIVGCTASAGAWMMSPKGPPSHSEIGLDEATQTLRDSRDPREQDQAVTIGTLRVIAFIEQLKRLPPPTIIEQPNAVFALRRIQEALTK